MNSELLDGVAVTVIALATVLVGSLGLRRAKTTRDFYVASRSVPPRWNAAAISGEYLSAASYLGIAGLVLAYGFDVLWYPVCYTAGYLILLALVAAPLRRSGAYTLPDFTQLRLGSAAVRWVSRALIVVIGWLYLVPQLEGASLTLRTQTGAPGWVGSLVVVVVVLIAVGVGGMRSITFAQALQFWVKLLAVTVPAIVLLGVWTHRGDTISAGYPRVDAATTVHVSVGEVVRVPVSEALVVHGGLDGIDRHGPVFVSAGRHTFTSDATVVLPRGAAVPVSVSLPDTTNGSWLHPLESGIAHPLYATWSLILAICLGTMGLPHVLVRFYTNRDGRDARRTTLGVLVLLSLFYLAPTLLATLGRHYVPDLLMTDNTDATVLELPGRMLAGSPGIWLGSLVTAGAFAAFLSTASGLAASVAGVLSQPWRAHRGPVSPEQARARRIRRFRLSAVASMAVPYALGLVSDRLGLAAVVGLAFAVAAATFSPLLVLGIWWPRLTDRGALCGLLVGGPLASAAVLITMLHPALPGWWGALLAQPAAWAVPVTFAAMIVVSLLTPERVPADVMRIMARLHTPESVVVDREPEIVHSSHVTYLSSQPSARTPTKVHAPSTRPS